MSMRKLKKQNESNRKEAVDMNKIGGLLRTHDYT